MILAIGNQYREEVTQPISSVEEHIESFKNDPYNSESGYYLWEE